MNPSSILSTTVRRPSFRLGAVVLAGVALLGGSLSAKSPLPENLSGGLDKLVASNIALKSAKAAGTKLTTFQSTQGKKYTTQQAAAFASQTITDDTGRILVRVHFNGLASFKEGKKAIKAAAPSLSITAVDKTYKAGVLNAYVDLDDVAALAEADGVGSVALELLPDLDKAVTPPSTPSATVGTTYPLVGTTYDAGVFQHRVDLINKFYTPNAPVDYEGQGMQIGFISDSFAKSTNAVTAAIDVTNYDLPGSASNPINTTPVAVLQDYTGTGTDEGRAMVQIGYRMAPKAALAFATANGGEVGFANNIRALAGIAGYTYAGQTFAADTICDDVTYADEPVYEDGIIAQGVEDASAAGVAYFSSAGNNIGTNTYESKFNYVPYTGGTTSADCPALAGTNISLANVPTGLYQGGFHNFNSTGTQDVAQTWGSTSSVTSRTSMQWDDPYNQTINYNTPAIYSATGNIVASSGTSQTFTTPTLTAGQNYVIIESATNSSGFDGIVSITDPNGVVVVNMQDTGTDETINFYPTVTGAYTITVSAYSTTGGSYAVNVYNGTNAKISTDFNLLVFDLEGNYLSGSSLATNNLSTNVPYEAGFTYSKSGETAVQYLVTRSAIPTITPTASVFRIDVRGNGASGLGPEEYFTVNQPNTKAHSTAPSCNSAAAYSVFRPSLPEYYTSPGPVVKYFDKLGNRLTTPEIRLKPTVAGADAANTSFFGSDSTSDIDTKGNFGGTSAAAPHLAAIGALVIQAHGGRRSVTPAQMTSILQRSTYPHDLDPNQATGTTRVTGLSNGKVTIVATSDLGLDPASGAYNPNSISVSYVGSGSIASLTFNPAGTAAQGGSTTGGNNGLDASNVYFDNLFPGIVFEPATIPFAVGNGSAALAGTTAAYTNLAPAPSNGTNQYWTVALTFPAAAFTGGNVFRFTVGHGPQHNSQVSNGTGATGGVTSTSFTQADLFGGTVLLPEGTGTGTGMSFSGTMTDGTTFSGTMKNNIGSGYAVTDGFGFVNAQTAVSQTVQ